MSWYKTGSVTANSGSKIITGAGTQFTNPLNGVSAGRMLLLPGSGTVQIYEIESVQSDTQLTLVSAFTGTAGSGKSYAIPTSPAVSIEQFAHEFASTLAYYQQQLQGWQSILTGTGNITLTTPDGQSVTVRSQAEWDRLLNTKMGAGQFGWGGSATVIPSSENILTYFSQPRASGIYSGLGNAGGPESPSGIFDSGKYEWILGYLDRYGTLRFTSYNQPFYSATNIWDNGTWRGWVLDWNKTNLPNPVTLDTAQTITNGKIFRYGDHPISLVATVTGGPIYLPFYDSNGTTRKGWIGRGAANDAIEISNDVTLARVRLLPDGSINFKARKITFTDGYGFMRNAESADYPTGGDFAAALSSEQSAGSCTVGGNWRAFLSVRHRGGNAGWGDSDRYGWAIVDNRMTQGNFNEFTLEKNVNGNFLPGVHLKHSGNTIVDANGFLKTASPVINIYSDGSFTTTDEAEGVSVEHLSEGVYKITGCQGMHSDAAWNGIDGGVSNPKCRNDKALLWNNYEVDEDGSVTVYTFHRVHSDAMPFAQNRLTLDKEPFDPENGHTPDMEWPDQTPIDVPRGLFIQVRVNMPEPEPVKPAVMSSNVCCNTISPA
ncbi:hypothetical protein [Pectobacterium carotovorum]|uniref:Phage tail protein C-terminal domain-containing protein n=1 Tax=Pectobacterium carotovorum subsp. carotovorum TaxID=555 RepID=A0AAI9KZH5_PECCC|nr:hypothetical protein [Pectobacterium carotovorum]GKX46078.1 hypothetical protein SOASR016_08300 [Pectobacterium carotovorum subsp. carotovorum]GLV68382.1 hypothetical protein Pcaca03_08260 [Pectobacterium carotovorum subsp. carotovorum]